MNVEMGTEAAQFPEKEYINGIFVAVHSVSSELQFKNSVHNWLYRKNNDT
jgi:hypothetical protein